MKQYDFMAEIDENGKTVVTVADAPKRRKKINIGQLLICFFISLGLWMYLVNLNDTGVTATMTLPVEIEGLDELRVRNNMMLYGLDTSEITVTVKGSNRDLRRYSQSDYRAYIDVSDILESGRYSRNVTVSLPVGTTITLDTKEVISVSFYTDISMTKQVQFDYLSGALITNPNYTWSIEKNADFVEISGPKSMVEAVELARFSIPSGEYYTSKNFSGFQLDFLDKNGDNITYDHSVVTYSTTDISVKVIVNMQKLVAVDVKLPAGISGIGAELEIDSIYIQGDPSVISSINKYTIALTEEDMAGGEEIYVSLIDEELPSGVSLVDPEQTLKITLITLEDMAESGETDDVTESGSLEVTEGDTLEDTAESGEMGGVTESGEMGGVTESGSLEVTEGDTLEDIAESDEMGSVTCEKGSLDVDENSTYGFDEQITEVDGNA